MSLSRGWCGVGEPRHDPTGSFEGEGWLGWLLERHEQVLERLLMVRLLVEGDDEEPYEGQGEEALERLLAAEAAVRGHCEEVRLALGRPEDGGK